MCTTWGDKIRDATCFSHTHVVWFKVLAVQFEVVGSQQHVVIVLAMLVGPSLYQDLRGSVAYQYGFPHYSSISESSLSTSSKDDCYSCETFNW